MKNWILSVALVGFGLSQLACQRGGDSSEWKDASTYEGPVVKNDWKIMWLEANPSTLNPVLSSDLYAMQTEAFIFDALIAPDAKTGDPIGKLATRWEISEDGLRYDFFIRENAKFHDGQPVTAEDVKFSFDIIKDPKVDAAHLANYYAGLDKVEVLGKHHVRVHMKDRYYRNLIVLGTASIMPKHIYGVGNFNENPANRQPVGSGPYKMTRWDTGRAIELDRFEDWWGNEDPYWKDRFNFNRIIKRVITEDAVAAMATKRGEIDVMEPKPEQFVDDFAGDEIEERFYRLRFDTMDGAGYRWIGWNLKRPTFEDKRVRQALALLLPRETINKRIFQDLMTLSVGPFPQVSPKTDPSIQPYPYDPTKALALLTEAGWVKNPESGLLQKDGKNFEFELMYTANSPALDQMALIYQRALEEVGIRMNIRTLEWTVFLQNAVAGNFDSVMMGWSSSWDSDPYQIWHSSQYENKGSNRIGFSHPRVDEILEKARITLDRDERNKLYQEFTKIIHEEAPYVFMFERPHLAIINRRFQNVLPIPKMGFDQTGIFTPPGFEKYGSSEQVPME
jgi:peptide/nickel transport system substrate-binding protein